MESSGDRGRQGRDRSHAGRRVRSATEQRAGRSLAFGEDRVELLARLVEDFECGLALGLRSVLADLEDDGHELAYRLTVVGETGVALRGLFPRRGLVGGLGDRGLAAVGEAVD